jgi:hypothetical protein
VINPRVVPAGTIVNATSVFTVPAGPATVLFANATSGGTIYVGPGTVVTALNGFPVVSGAVPPVTVPVYPGSAAQQWSALAPAGTASLLLLISAPPGGTGTGQLG